MSKLRLQKYIAEQGICSRRKAEALIRDGCVQVNGAVITEMGVQIDPVEDHVTIDGKRLGEKQKESRRYTYIALNKPVDYVTSTSSAQGRSVMDLLGAENAVGKDQWDSTVRVYPVGRLDKDSEGLVLLTDDGELANELTHPRHEHEKEYEVTVDKPLTHDARAVLTRGMRLGDEVVGGIALKKVENRGKRTIVTVILTEGKNRQLRKMFGRLGYHVLSLKRTRIGKLKIGTLPTGKWRLVDKHRIV